MQTESLLQLAQMKHGEELKPYLTTFWNSDTFILATGKDFILVKIQDLNFLVEQ